MVIYYNINMLQGVAKKLKNISPQNTQITRKKQKNIFMMPTFGITVGLHKARCRLHYLLMRKRN